MTQVEVSHVGERAPFCYKVLRGVLPLRVSMKVEILRRPKNVA
jgi:hypothetical protein